MPRRRALGLLALLGLLMSAPTFAGMDLWQRRSADSPLQEALAYLFPSSQFGKSYALVIGVGDYDAVEKLDAPHNDALRMRDFLRDDAGFDYIVTLTDADATQARITQLMETDFPQRLHSNDRFLFYFSGHGATRIVGTERSPRGYLLLKSSRPGHWDEMIAMPQIREWAENLGGVRHVLFVLDACFSGLAAYQPKSVGSRSATLLRLGRPSSYVLTAGVDQEESYSYNGESLFTQAFLATARGQFEPPADGIVSLDDMVARIDRYIDAKSQELGGPIRMTPQLYRERTEDNEGEFFFLIPGRGRVPGPVLAVQGSGAFESKAGLAPARAAASLATSPPGASCSLPAWLEQPGFGELTHLSSLQLATRSGQDIEAAITDERVLLGWIYVVLNHLQADATDPIEACLPRRLDAALQKANEGIGMIELPVMTFRGSQQPRIAADLAQIRRQLASDLRQRQDLAPRLGQQ